MKFLPTGIVIGPLRFNYYGMIILAGVLAGAKLSSLAGKKRGFTEDDYWDMLPWMLILGILGARLWHVCFPAASSGITFGWYLQHPAEILAVWNGGLGVPGGILFGAFGIWLFCRRRKYAFPKFIDTIGIGLPFAQAIGRWGNYINQELYGLPTDLPWAVRIAPENRIAPYLDRETYHPLFLYESLYNLILTFILWKLDRSGKLKHDGDVFLCYLIAYPVGRFFLEFLRLDSAYAGGLNINQCVMAVTAVISASALILRSKKDDRKTAHK